MNAGRFRACAVCALAAAFVPRAAPPPELPGEEITEQYLQRLIPPDSVQARTPPGSPHSPTWLDEAMRTWVAPVISEQIGEGNPFLPVGKGAMLIPRMTDAVQEPDVEVYDSTGEVVGRGKPGETLAMLPGNYSVVFGNGSHRQQLVRQVRVEEGRVVPVIPDWSGLVVDVVNESNEQFDGDYELVRIDEFDAYGRGRGVDPDQGEETMTWILRPGVYKVLSTGDGYNTLKNFITVRLLPGALTRVLLVVNEEDLKIVGGGVIDVLPEKPGKRNWSLGIDLGGSILFDATIDRLEQQDEHSSNSSTIALLLNAWSRYDHKPWEWTSSLRLDEGLTVPNFEFDEIQNTIDNVRLRSLLVWRLLNWLGPYARFETQTSLFAEYTDLPAGAAQFYVVNEAGTQGDAVSDSSKRVEGPFSPFTLETGLGASADVVDARWFDLRFRIGMGYGFTTENDIYESGDTSDISPALYAADSALIATSSILRKLGTTTLHEAGPEAAIIANLRLGNFALARLETRLFAPVAPEVRFNRPDLDVEATLSWRIARFITLDYEFDYTLKQGEDIEQDLVRHGVRLRFSLRTQ